ncbi:hypothetical protein A4X13_0g8044 [Tilletia indica]|uniref:Integrase catalytic domain-containing protein n=1 Tax=Tilletia indica TaxID=43049 RepID=A0A177T6P8_9BASI|nr:hypothetical protein A4X13_0g8044 [Tilletia indica]
MRYSSFQRSWPGGTQRQACVKCLRLLREDGTPATAERIEIPWDASHQATFDALKRAIASPPVPAHPDPEHDLAPAPTVSAALVHTLSLPLLPLTVARERWRAWLLRDRFFGPILQAVEAGDVTGEWVLEGDLLTRRVDEMLALPESGIPDLLREVHDRRGHFGFTKSYLALRRHFWRPGLSTIVRAWVKHCPPCIATKLSKKSGGLDIEDDTSLPFDAIALDILLGFPRSRAGNDAVLVVLDLFSRMLLLEPCPASITAEGIAAVLSNRVLRSGWRPRRLVPDSEAHLTGEVMTALAASPGATLAPSVPHHHQANPAERAIQIVKHVLQALSVDSCAHWDKRAVPAAELAMNSTPSVTTGFCPFDLVFLRIRISCMRSSTPRSTLGWGRSLSDWRQGRGG